MKVGIVGSGAAGLTAAYRLSKQGVEVEVYEKADCPAGLAASVQLGNTWIEKYYHHIFTHDQYLLDLIGELGLTSQLLWRETKMGFYHEGNLHPFSTPQDLLSFKPLSLLNRLRFGASTLLMSRNSDWTKLENETAEAFLLRYAGREVYEVIWQPLLRIKFGEKYKTLPAVWIWERIVQRARTRQGAEKEVLGYLDGGFHQLFAQMLGSIEGMGGRVHLKAPVDRIEVEDGKCLGLKVNGESVGFDAVIVTASLPEFVRICPDAGEDYLASLRKVTYDATLGVMLVLNKRLSDYYWINISDREVPFGGLIEHTNFVSPEHYANKHILYFSKYLPADDPLYHLPESDLLALYLRNLQKIAPGFDSNDVEACHVFKDEHAQPIWPMNYSQIKPDFKTPIKNLYLSNTAQIYPNDRGMNFSVGLGNKVCEVLGETSGS